ncbi:MAG: hypothetical protein KME27_23140 [Lyngbya sp. HA4199-MV5]|jgi:hypothetical protein|nr:hypothetical protein [Lyngbya sp. HA4199-MV5]
MTTTTDVTTAWGKLDYNPKEATSTVNGIEYTTQLDKNGEKVRIYYKIGGLCDYLKKGDTVMIEWVKGKWKLGKTQTPELLATLEQRKQAAAPPAPTDAPPPRTTVRPANDNDVIEMAAIAQKLAAMLPDWQEQAIASLACTVFIQRGK